ncbi:DEAD/DEAH box helicase family protein [Candidatus Saccharibacteria bacterium]|nr:DEAD/DEAH box helicase family protein [Candidatus Saccharibacteria bacterium]
MIRVAVKTLRTIESRIHQGDCLAALDAARVKGADKALVIMASGLGKTITAILDAKKFIEQHGGRVLCLCHRNDILDQLKVEFQDVMEALGSEYSYGMYNGNEKQDTVCGKKGGEKVDFLFASFQTMADDMRRSEFARNEFTYIIVDEAHHAPARTFYKTLKHFTPKFLLGMTATPDRKDNADLNAIFGKTVFELRFPEAVARKLLVKPKVRLLMDEVAKLGEIYWKEAKKKISASELNKRMFARIRDEAIIRLIHEEVAMAEISDPRTVIYCRGVKHAENIAALIDGAVLFHSYYRPEREDQPAYTQKDAAENLQAFREGRAKTIVAIDKLNEGIDVPAINVMVNLRQLGSRIPAEQQFGRGLRLYPGKEFVLILDFVANCQRLKMYWEMDRDIREFQQKIHPDDLKIPGGGSSNRNDVSGLDISTNDPNFQREDLDLMTVITEIIAMTEPYTRDQLILQLQQKAKLLGRTPTMKEVDADPSMASCTTLQFVFGSYNAACRAAGLEPNREYIYSAEEPSQILDAFIDWSIRNNGKTPRAADLHADPTMPSAALCKKVFGSLAATCRAAKLVVNKYSTRYTHKMVVDMIQDWQIRNNNKTPSKTDFESDQSLPSPIVCVNLFGSIPAAQKAAGCISNPTPPSYTDEQLESLLYDCSVRNAGRVPTQKEVDADPLMPSASVYIRRYGKFSLAQIAAGLRPNQVGGNRRKKKVTKQKADE